MLDRWLNWMVVTQAITAFVLMVHIVKEAANS